MRSTHGLALVASIALLLVAAPSWAEPSEAALAPAGATPKADICSIVTARLRGLTSRLRGELVNLRGPYTTGLKGRIIKEPTGKITGQIIGELGGPVPHHANVNFLGQVVAQISRERSGKITSELGGTLTLHRPELPSNPVPSHCVALSQSLDRLENDRNFQLALTKCSVKSPIGVCDDMSKEAARDLVQGLAAVTTKLSSMSQEPAFKADPTAKQLYHRAKGLACYDAAHCISKPSSGPEADAAARTLESALNSFPLAVHRLGKMMESN